jgi:hypothetical protein
LERYKRGVSRSLATAEANTHRTTYKKHRADGGLILQRRSDNRAAALPPL